MTAVLTILITFLLTSLASALLLGSRYRLVPKTIKMPFGDFDVSRFSDLSPMILFANVSKYAVSVDPAAQMWLSSNKKTLSPLLMVHLAWQIVCDTFVEQYDAYPTDEEIRKHIKNLGSQNVEFIITFRRIYEYSIGYMDQLTLDFATSYFLRAPSLARRISPSSPPRTSDLYDFMLKDVAAAGINAA
ncbi:MAG: hypothetical protein V4574_08330 [Pseudomonadota bacterium]